MPYPNPFVEEITIPFTINEDGSNVTILIMDQLGRVVSEVVNSPRRHEWQQGSRWCLHVLDHDERRNTDEGNVCGEVITVSKNGSHSCPFPVFEGSTVRLKEEIHLPGWFH